MVRWIFDTYLGGSEMRPIARQSAEDGHRTPTGARWTDVRVWRLLRRANYAPRWVHHGEVIGPAAWPAFIDDDAFDRVDARIEERQGRHVEQSRGPG